tara:strand:- start:12563 stop:12937 length:375 start_codon:yes stop_codon:yes gene_type:complete
MKFKKGTVYMFKKMLTTLALILTANSALAAERLELNFFADQQQFEMQERKKLVKFLKDHEPGDVYEFELLSLLDPLKIGLDDRRLKDIQAVFRQYGVNIDGLLNAKIKFIASEEQKFVVIRKSK